jgi:hypothetical protein
VNQAIRSIETDRCENHGDYLEAFLEKSPNPLLEKRDAHYVIITVDQEGWATSLENPDKNTVTSCQVWSISEGMRGASRLPVVV